jgi:hypothetical protein
MQEGTDTGWNVTPGVDEEAYTHERAAGKEESNNTAESESQESISAQAFGKKYAHDSDGSSFAL